MRENEREEHRGEGRREGWGRWKRGKGEGADGKGGIDKMI
jgi:hypothetical protein